MSSPTQTGIDPAVRLAIARKCGSRDPKDGKPFYCVYCGAGWSEYIACEDVHCELEKESAALRRFEPVPPIPEIVGYNVGDYSDIMDEPL